MERGRASPMLPERPPPQAETLLDRADAATSAAALVSHWIFTSCAEPSPRWGLIQPRRTPAPEAVLETAARWSLQPHRAKSSESTHPIDGPSLRLRFAPLGDRADRASVGSTPAAHPCGPVLAQPGPRGQSRSLTFRRPRSTASASRSISVSPMGVERTPPAL